ncbi:MAG: hypothetical protein VX527_11885 [Planctomycetota bacterium]|nr:hypothetical protein [Planctomycetota bacterium]
MKNNTILWLIIFVLGAVGLAFAAINRAGETWVQETHMSYVGISSDIVADGVEKALTAQDEDEAAIQKAVGSLSGIGKWAPSGSPEADVIVQTATALGHGDDVQTVEWTEYKTVPLPKQMELLRETENATAEQKAQLTATLRQEGIFVSSGRTIGVWLAALFTLAIMSFLVGDNPLYKTAEAVVVGASAAYWMVYSFYTGIVDKLLVGLWPGLARDWAVPGMQADAAWDWVYIIPAVLSIMLLWRLAPMGGWISRWPLAFIIGATAGFRMLGFLESDFIVQIQHTISNLWFELPDGSWDMWASVAAWVVLIGVLACLTYFFFSVEHKGVVGKTARLGIYFLMVAFGSAFAFTVMGRITLLTERFGFLFRDWLHVLD